jgi:hypothetical protein
MVIDFALTPTGDVDVTGSFAGLLKVRPDTILLGPEAGHNARSIKSFLAAIDLEAPDKQIGNIVITSHAAPSGLFAIQLTDGSPRELNYDDLAEALASNPNVIRASGGIVGRAIDDAGILVKGCDLGRSPEFMELLQRAIGPAKFGIIASLYGHAAVQHDKKGNWIEFMLYEFHQDYFLSRDNKFDTLDKDKIKDLDRDQLLADMKANPRNRRFDGSSFSDQEWESMIPPMPSFTSKKIPKPTRKLFKAKFPPSWNLEPFLLHEAEGRRLLDIERFEVTNPILATWDIQGEAGPGNKAPISERRAFVKAHLANDPKHQATHPYPIYKRHGFASLDDYIDNFDWGKPDENGDTWIAKTWRFVKVLPITDPDTGELIANHYGPGITREHQALLETSGFLFAAIPASP